MEVYEVNTGEYLAIWLETYIEPFRRPSTAAGYRRAIDAVPPEVLQMPLSMVDGLTLQRAINAKARRHPRAAQLQYAVLHSAFKRAHKLRMMEQNPMEAVEKPLHHARKAVILNAEQLRRYLIAARNERVYPLLLLIALCGLRRSEALGLTWAAISGGVLRIEQQRVRVTGKGMQTAPLKSASSRRDLPLAPQIVQELTAWRSAEGIRSFTGWICDTTPETLAKAHRRILAAEHLPPVTLHGLRHTMATLMAADGTAIKVLQGILGHSQYKLTADLYADHLTAEAYAGDLSRMATKICSFL